MKISELKARQVYVVSHGPIYFEGNTEPLQLLRSGEAFLMLRSPWKQKNKLGHPVNCIHVLGPRWTGVIMIGGLGDQYGFKELQCLD